MMSYLESKNKNDCTGCTACSQICLHKAIEMKEDEQGFLYPYIDLYKCTKCGLCKAICPEKKLNIFYEPKECYAALCKDKSKMLSSASGGAFYGIVASCDSETEICGAVWYGIGRSKVQHQKVVSNKAYNLFRKSKYVQSNLLDIFKEIEKSLKEGKKIIFTGTPCQVAGLKNFLRKEYDNLLLVDLICHGVSSSFLLEKCLQCFDKKRDKVRQVTFRHKELKGKNWNSKLIKLEYQSGKSKVLDYDGCGFLRGYDNGLLFRPSCYSCRYSNSNRISDLTIGDFWGGEQYGYNPHHGASLIIVNTEKGKCKIKQISKFMDLEKIDYKYVVEHNACLRKSKWKKENPKKMFVLKRLQKEKFEDVICDIVPPIPKWKKIAHKVKTILVRC